MSMSLAARRVFVAMLAIVGTYYTWVGGTVLIHVGEVTRRWTLLSGDPDFPADAPRFSVVIGIAAMLWLSLGAATVYCSVRMWTGRHVSRVTWSAITVAMIFLHVPWLLYRHIGTGTLGRLDAAVEMRVAFRQFLIVTLVYVAGWIATWRWPVSRAATPWLIRE